MIISKLPDPETAGNGGSGAAKNAVLYASTRQKYHYPSHITPYMVAVNFLNKGHYTINSRPATMSEKCFYFLNPGDQLAIKFNHTLPLETMFVFFNEQFVEDSIYSITNSCAYLLDNPQDQGKRKLNIPNIPFYTGKVLSKFSALLAQDLRAEELDDCLYDFLTAFVKMDNELSLELEKINSVKKATREELYKRLFVGREFMEDNLTLAITIDDIAAAACMNKFHFLANFKSLYGTTPHQFLMELKLQKAYHLLKTQRSPVTEACYSVGFESLPSFSTLFRKRFGVSPSLLTQAN